MQTDFVRRVPSHIGLVAYLMEEAFKPYIVHGTEFPSISFKVKVSITFGHKISPPFVHASTTIQLLILFIS